MITLINGKYVCVLPEYNLHQDLNPDTQQPFASQTDAQAWETAYIALCVAHVATQAAEAAATQAAADATEAARIAALPRTITKLEYMNLFTEAELVAIYTAAKTSVLVEIWLDKFKLVSEVDLRDPTTAGGLQSMEAAGLIAAGRAAQILA